MRALVTCLAAWELRNQLGALIVDSSSVVWNLCARALSQCKRVEGGRRRFKELDVAMQMLRASLRLALRRVSVSSIRSVLQKAHAANVNERLSQAADSWNLF